MSCVRVARVVGLNAVFVVAGLVLVALVAEGWARAKAEPGRACGVKPQ